MKINDDCISNNSCVDTEKLVKGILEQGQIFNDIEEDLLHDLMESKISKDSNVVHAKNTTFGNKMADKIAAEVGSWKFIIIALSGIAIWIIFNKTFKNGFDPFPFILLNLVLSCTAAIQAPVIMMSQNRTEEKDRIKSKNDYKVNLKSELIIEDLHKKMDTLIENQANMVEIIKEMQKQINNKEKVRF